jgi:undecaprenyl-diphosphatase
MPIASPIAVVHPHVRRVIRWFGSHDLGLVVALCLAASAIWIFAEIAEAVRERDSHAFDRTVILAMRHEADRNDPIGPAWFEEVARDVSALGGTVVLCLVTVGVIGYLLLRRARTQALLLAISVVGAQLASSLLKLGFDRPRPDLVPARAVVYTASFPSGHALVAAATYLTLAGMLTQLHRDRLIRGYVILLALMIVVLIGVSRVYLGVHWPSDVLAGWAAGGAWALLVWSGARWFGRPPPRRGRRGVRGARNVTAGA